MTKLVHAVAARSYRAKTEDRVAVHEIPEGLLVVLADGAGGIPGGALAAETLMRCVADEVDADARALDAPGRLLELLVHLDLRVLRELGAGETTAILALVNEHGVQGASCGDSVAWMVGASGYDELTLHQKRGLRVGGGRVHPASFACEWEDGTLVVGSDGLFGYAPTQAICQAARESRLDAAAAKLVATLGPNDRELYDDVAVAVVRAVTSDVRATPTET